MNPTVSHPRWSQATERKIGGGLFNRRHPTLMFNGYEAEVADLYEGYGSQDVFLTSDSAGAGRLHAKAVRLMCLLLNENGLSQCLYNG